MPAFNVFLGALGNSGLDQAAKDNVRSTLQGWFTSIVNGSSYSGAVVSWVDSAPSIQNNELLIYFVAGRGDSILTSLPGYHGGAGSGDGLTAWVDPLTASEVYVATSTAYLPQMAFHEAMHNKLHLGDTALHRQDGLARSPVSVGGTPSADNIRRMRAALDTNHQQWTGGWSAYNDPLRGI
ncbi:MAG: hypothetical protein JOZ52_13695 [Acidobacteria bacterium]|nr:hypothetical protein [Acidobacteriota bacterium]